MATLVLTHHMFGGLVLVLDTVATCALHLKAPDAVNNTGLTIIYHFVTNCKHIVFIVVIVIHSCFIPRDVFFRIRYLITPL